MKIAGSMNYVKFDLENGYVIKAEGEMLVGRKFVAYLFQRLAVCQTY